MLYILYYYKNNFSGLLPLCYTHFNNLETIHSNFDLDTSTFSKNNLLYNKCTVKKVGFHLNTYQIIENINK